MILWRAFLFVLTMFLGGVFSVAAGSGPSSMAAPLSDDLDDLESPSDFDDLDDIDDSQSVSEVVNPGGCAEPDFSLPVVRSWAPGGLRRSSSSVSFKDEVITSRQKLFGCYSAAIDQIHNFRSGKHQEIYLLDGDIDVSEYEKQCLLARQSLLDCYQLLIRLKNAIESKLFDLNPVDDRICRSDCTQAMPEYVCRFKDGYRELCLIYREYLRTALTLGLGIINPAKRASRILEEPHMFATGLCGSCTAIWRSVDFNCANCGVSMLFIPEETFFESSCNLLRLVKNSHEFKKTIQICLDALEDSAV